MMKAVIAMIMPANSSASMIASQFGVPRAVMKSSDRTSARPASSTIAPCAKLNTPDAL